MNRKLTDAQITSTFELLRNAGQNVSGRALRAALRQQYGAAGKTGRVFAICRRLREPEVPEPERIAQLRGQMMAAEQDRASAQDERDRAIERAERSEAREISHQDRWANEIHALRESVEQLKDERTRRQRLEDHVLGQQQKQQSRRPRRGRDEVPPARSAGHGPPGY
jgi:hypothetical protein